MADLKSRISEATKTAMKARDKDRVAALRMINAEIKRIEVDERKEVTDAEVEAILAKYLKQREDAKAQFMEAGRDDLVSKEEEEIAIVSSYLPEPLSDEELENALKEIILQVSAESMRDMGKVMGAAKSVIGSRADGGRINQVVKQLLS